MRRTIPLFAALVALSGCGDEAREPDPPPIDSIAVDSLMRSTEEGAIFADTPVSFPPPPFDSSVMDSLVQPPEEGPVADTPVPFPPPTVREKAPKPVAATGCHPSYRPCVPIDTDVDCEGKGGNGPSYVRGPIEVIGEDEYGLDRDHDGIGCEN